MKKIMKLLCLGLAVLGMNNNIFAQKPQQIRPQDYTPIKSHDLLTIGGQTVKPVTGTWLNLVWQDERNNYMNPGYLDNTSPELWKTKVNELHQIGVDYLVIMQVANEQKAFYPSDFMPKAYQEGKESPVEAILSAADKNGQKVLLSCGWAKSQLDNNRDPEVKHIQMKIMNELAAKFKSHPSFWGWYLPIEDCFNPYLSDAAIEAANAMTAKAKELTPDKKVMISPYGLFYNGVQDAKFGEQIAKLKVDIIAYQDEIGCVRKPLPLQQMKKNFAALRSVHDKAGIELWANVESFTWDKNPNNWFSILIPAPFGRYLSQIIGVNEAKVDRVVSFAIYGIYDKPYSPYPLGQPIWSNKVYEQYTQWLTGKGQWPYLAASFANQLKNEAEGVKVKSNCVDCYDKACCNEKSNKDKQSFANLVDGKLGYEDYNLPEWVKFPNGHLDMILDLGKAKEINRIGARFLNYRKGQIAIPPMVDFYISKDGKTYSKVQTVNMDVCPNNLHDCWIDMALTDNLKVSGRYVRVVARSDSQVYANDGVTSPIIMCDEIFVNPQIEK